jgi:methylated-DNA-[protein]-cysteine S-methyltransferase
MSGAAGVPIPRRRGALFPTALGTCGIAWSERGITHVQLPEESEAATRERLLTRSRASIDAPVPDAVARTIARITAHLEGRLDPLDDVVLDLDVAPFVRRVYDALVHVPPGRTTTYGELARAAGSSTGAARAVGRAMATNPVPLLVPCHRVLGGTGLGGFSAHGGGSTKERLLRLEGATPTQPELPLFPIKG